MSVFGSPESVRSTAQALARVASATSALAPDGAAGDWRGPAAEAYLSAVHAVGPRHHQLCNDLHGVVELLAGLAEALRSANDAAAEVQAAVVSAEHRCAAVAASGDAEAATMAADQLDEIRAWARSSLARRTEAIEALDRDVARRIDAALPIGPPLVPIRTSGGDGRLAAVEELRIEISAMAIGARAAMLERAEELSVRIRRLETVLAYLRSLGVRGVRLRWFDVLRRHHARLKEWGASRRQFLRYDADDGSRVVEVFGDLAAARHIAVIVPGIATSEYSYDRYLGPAAERLWGRDPAVAIVAWLGYDTPGSGPDGTGALTFDAIDDHLARNGAAELADFVEWLAVRRSDAHLSVIGHSYGSVVAAIAAAEHGLEIDDLVLVGSPGVPVENAAGLRLRPEGTVWAGLAPWDPIDELARAAATHGGMIHGTDPTAEGFGAVELEFDGAFGHSGYFDRAGLAVLAPVVRSCGDGAGVRSVGKERRGHILSSACR